MALRRRIDPRAAAQLPDPLPLIVVAPYLSKSVREVLKRRGASYADRTGNVRIVLDEPGLFVLTSGAGANPWPDKRQLSLRGVKAGRVVRALVASVPPLGVRQLAGLASTDPGYVSRLLALLDAEALVDRTSRGRVERVDWRKLVARWAGDAPLSDRATATTWLAPRGLKGILGRLRGAEPRYLVTGSAAAAKLAPVAPTRWLSVYVDDPTAMAEQLDLRPADAGANVVLLQPEDEAIYEQGTEIEGVHQAALPLIVVDLLTGPGRSPAEAEALMDWMDDNEGAWRG
jgi:hypothetical protein